MTAWGIEDIALNQAYRLVGKRLVSEMGERVPVPVSFHMGNNFPLQSTRQLRMTRSEGVGSVAAPGMGNNVDPAHVNVATGRGEAGGNPSRSQTTRKPPRPAATPEDDIAIFRATAEVQPQFKEWGHRAAAWEQVAMRVNDELKTNDISGDLCKRRYELLISKVTLGNAIPQRGVCPLDDKLYTLVLEAMQNEKKHERDMATIRTRQRKEFEDDILRERPQRSTGSDSERGVLVQDALQQQACRGGSGGCAHADTPQQTSLENVTTNVADICATQIRALETEMSSQLSRLRQVFQEERQRTEEEAAQVTSALRAEIAELREECAACISGHAKHIECLIFQTQAQHSELTRLDAELKLERTHRNELLEEMVQLKNATMEGEEAAQRERNEVAALVAIPVHNLQNCVRQHVEIMEQQERLLRLAP